MVRKLRETEQTKEQLLRPFRSRTPKNRRFLGLHFSEPIKPGSFWVSMNSFDSFDLRISIAKLGCPAALWCVFGDAETTWCFHLDRKRQEKNTDVSHQYETLPATRKSKSTFLALIDFMTVWLYGFCIFCACGASLSNANGRWFQTPSKVSRSFQTMSKSKAVPE